MILTCPNCGTQYVVKDGAIPPQGRQVRCASCKHSWHQDPDEIFEEAAPTASEEADATPEEETLAEATLIDPRSGPEAEERAYEETMVEEAAPSADYSATDAATPEAPVLVPADHDVLAKTVEESGGLDPAVAGDDWRGPPDAEAQDDHFSPFPERGEGPQPRRGRGILRALLVVLLVAALAAVFWFFAPPAWKARVGLGAGGSSPLALVTTHMDRQRLESGNELLTVTGRVINPTSESQDIPPLQAQLKTKTGQIVYSWTIAPPARSLPPGASARFNSAEVNVPPGGDELTITLGSPKV